MDFLPLEPRIPIRASLIKLLDGFLASRAFPGGVLIVGKPLQGKALAHPFGTLGLTRDIRPVTLGSVYDLASITKIASTTFLIMRAIDAGRFSLDSSLGKLGFTGPPEPLRFRISDLLTHSSGLPAWSPLYILDGEDKDSSYSIKREKVTSHIFHQRPLFSRGEKTLYSDLGFVLLGFVLEKVFGDLPLRAIFQEYASNPLGLFSTGFSPRGDLSRIGFLPLRGGIGGDAASTINIEPSSDKNPSNYLDPTSNPYDIAPTEDGFRVGGPLTLNGLPFLGPVPLGRVHDDNAAYLSGAAGHAGLFSNGPELWKIIRAFIEAYQGGSSILSQEISHKFLKAYKAQDQSQRAMGFDAFPLPGGGERLLFGHLGYAGGSVHFDPDRDEAMILLTNRVHPTSRNSQMDLVRRKLLELCFGENIFKGL
jgi:CubicO group peptidase (beta-lactamase class C family)